MAAARRGVGHLRSADGLILPTVLEALKELDLAPRDQAAAKLAQLNAAMIDRAAVNAAELAAIASETEDSGVWAKIRSLEAKLDQQVAIKDIGPRLLDVLEALGATPRARGAKGGGDVPASRGGLAAIRSARSA